MPSRHPLQEIKSFPSLVKYLRDVLEWPISSESFDDLTFEFAPEELGLDAQAAAKVREIKQLRPLATNQPWGIFFVSFEPKRLPIVALRKILGSLAIKKRASANPAHRAAWQLHDLLFISAFGEGDDRQITLAHFSDSPNGQNIPTLKVLGWDELDTQLNLAHVEGQLKERLRWPNQPGDIAAWCQQWSAAFTLRPRHVISTAQELAERLAELARLIREKVKQVLAIETERGALRKLFAAFRESLIHDLDENDFADMYAQTITYGLFSAAVSRTASDDSMGSRTHVVADNLADMVPITNPFLKEILGTFLTVGGKRGKLDFDELGVQEVVELLNSDKTNLPAVIRNFGDRRRGEDPVIHFYEDFLKQYDKQRKVERGVFYTPQPVVSYIVRSVHELLKAEFGLEDGLASTATWADMLASFPELELPTIAVHGEVREGVVNRPIDPQTPFVQILDPATGTATFLVEVIDVIHRTLTEKWSRQDLPREQQRAAWNQYVPRHLLPRLHGYELMMAPYAIAHMKIGLKLHETGYKFQSNERARVYLTNALEPASEEAIAHAADLFAALGHEAAEVSDIKRKQRFTVIVGNPPYSGISSNMSEYAQRLVDAYRSVDGAPLNERKLWLQDDYVKFVRWAQRAIEWSGVGIIGLITNHGYLDNPTFRGMRQSLMTTFTRLSVLNLHGNANKKEKAPDGSDDKNVFDIRQGVAICLAMRGARNHRVEHADLWGSRETKYGWLSQCNFLDSGFESITPDSPYYFLVPQDIAFREEYASGIKITELFPIYSSGIVTARDSFVVAFDDHTLRERMQSFLDMRKSDETIKREFALTENYVWRVKSAREALRTAKRVDVILKTILYRPFDFRRILYHSSVVFRTRENTMRHLFSGRNIALATTRSVEIGRFEHALCTREIIGHHTVSMKEVNYIFPLWLEVESQSGDRPGVPNIAPTAHLKLLKALGMSQSNLQRSRDSVSPEQLFRYVFSVLNSHTYRRRYAEQLKTDFARIPLPGSIELFDNLVCLGGELVTYSLLESPKVNQFRTQYVGGRNSEITRVAWCDNTVWIDAPARKKGTAQQPGSAGFQGVPEEVWNFHIGGYQVCEKWLKDRKGRRLSADDIAHYQKIIVALSETIRIMAEIDNVIDRHGGWPGAFAIGAPPDDGQSPTDEPEQATLPFV